jgi:hypothetical protein
VKIICFGRFFVSKTLVDIKPNFYLFLKVNFAALTFLKWVNTFLLNETDFLPQSIQYTVNILHIIFICILHQIIRVKKLRCESKIRDIGQLSVLRFVVCCFFGSYNLKPLNYFCVKMEHVCVVCRKHRSEDLTIFHVFFM